MMKTCIFLCVSFWTAFGVCTYRLHVGLPSARAGDDKVTAGAVFCVRQSPEPAKTEREKNKQVIEEWGKFFGVWRTEKFTVGGDKIKPKDDGKKSIYFFGADGWGFQELVDDKVKRTGEFELDPATRQITLKYGGGASVGIYSISGDQLTMAFDIQHPHTPPKDLSGSGKFEAVWHLQRIKE